MTNNPFSELQKKLEESIKSFPYVYLFKFIVNFIAFDDKLSYCKSIFEEKLLLKVKFWMVS